MCTVVNINSWIFVIITTYDVVVLDSLFVVMRLFSENVDDVDNVGSGSSNTRSIIDV